MSRSSCFLGGDLGLEHETVDLRLGQRVGSLLLQGVLRGQHEERLRQGVGVVADGHLTLLHGLQQRRLHFGRGAVDLVRQYEVGEDRTLAYDEILVLLRVDQRADQVGGQQVGGELYARETGVDGLGERGDGQRLGQSRDAFQKDVSVGQQADQQGVHQVALAHDDLSHFVAERIDENGFAFDALVEFFDVDDFAHCICRVILFVFSILFFQRFFIEIIANLIK